MSAAFLQPRQIFILLAMVCAVCGFSAAQDAPSGRNVVRRVTPQYPEIARSMRLQGNVKVEVVVSSTGAVKSVDVKGGNPLLAESAKRAILQWTWDPARRETHELVEVKFNP